MAGRAKRAAKAKIVQERAPGFQGWNTSDAEEIERRRWRGLTDIAAVDSLEPGERYFGTFRVRSTTGGSYEVEIRSLTERENSCGCADWRVNGLGTCKHIEGVLDRLSRTPKRAFRAAARAGSPRIEIFPTPDDDGIKVRQPTAEAVAAAAPFLTTDGLLAGDVLQTLPALRTALAAFPVRVSRHLDARLEEERRRRRRIAERATFEAEIAAGTASLDFLHHRLLPYQVEGMLHLAFGERALLADEMGLGKTVQAIAACELLRRRRGIERVLVVLPASLKAEWEEQIARFTDLSVTIVSGPRPERLRRYEAKSFFILVNYEQVLIDRHDINRIMAPDVVILDEAQRIKNWQTKTAKAVKELRSPYAFVLTGTPLENRIDEVYSIVQYLDPRLLGPLFRFNRDYYVLDERGRPIDYKNLTALRERLAPVMLRRRKDEVEGQLPGRTVDTYFVAMTDEQRLRYKDYETPARRLIAQAQRRPLSPQEFDRLQQLLACMRMVCDTPYILDPACRISPKLDEIETILGDLLADPQRKVILFSEWERMLDLVRELAGEMGIEFAWHTGSVPQDKRRVEIRRFKDDPACRLFLSTDSGSVGLNLQVASAVINVDLPWNPAKLEQRIARAWRKHQTRPVTVVNLVCEDSIEHSILHLLAHKQGLADGVLDGRGDVAALKMPSGRAAMVERMAALLGAPTPAPVVLEPARRFLNDAADLLTGGVLMIERYRRDDGSDMLVVVTDPAAADAEASRRSLAEAAARAGCPAIDFIDHAAWETMRRLAEAGIIRLSGAPELLHRSPLLDEPVISPEQARRSRHRERAAGWLGVAERKIRMASLLTDGGFAEEALAPIGEAASLAIRSLALIVDGDEIDAIPDLELGERESVRPHLPPGSIAFLAALGTGDAVPDLDIGRTAAQGLFAAATAMLDRDHPASSPPARIRQTVRPAAEHAAAA